MQNKIEECLECGEEFEVEGFIDSWGEPDYDYPETCPYCGEEINYSPLDPPEDFHSDI